MATEAETINLSGIVSETKRIINAHSRHFLALSLIFLLPISFFITIYPTLVLQLQSSFNNHLPYPQTLFNSLNPPYPQTLFNSLNPDSHQPFESLVAPIIFSLFIAFFSISAVATITYSTFHGFYGRPVRLGSAIKSLMWSLVPLVVTALCGLLLVCFITLLLGLGFYIAISVIVMIFGVDVEFGYDWSNWSLVLFVFGLVLVLVLVYLQVHCTLGCVVVVVESKWGFEALRRSGVLIKGMRLVSLWLLLFGCVTVVFPLWLNSVPLVRFEGGFDFWKSAGFVVQTVLSSSFVTLFMLISISANAVLYMYCKALHGELASEIAEEFARDYVSLPFDDDKVPHIVTVVQA